jgi:ABC-type sugar transport system substrate-binding protein
MAISTMLLVAVFSMLILGATRPNTPVFRPPNVQSGVTADVETLKPTQDEINAAHQSVSDNHFVAVMPCNQSSEYHSRLTREMTDFLRAYNLTHRIYNPDSDPYRQIALFETARAEGAFAFIICPLDYLLLQETFESLEQIDAPMVFPATDRTYGGVSLYTDNFAMGEAVGRFTGEVIRDEMGGRARVVVLTLENNETVEARTRGLISGLAEIAPEAEIVAEVRGAVREWGKESVENLLADGINFDVIMSINDAGSFGAIEALQAANIPTDAVIITSVDAEALALRYIRDGTYMRSSLAVARREFAEGAVDVMVKMLAGSPVPEFVTIPVGEMITQENLPDTTQ